MNVGAVPVGRPAHQAPDSQGRLGTNVKRKWKNISNPDRTTQIKDVLKNIFFFCVNTSMLGVEVLKNQIVYKMFSTVFNLGRATGDHFGKVKIIVEKIKGLKVLAILASPFTVFDIGVKSFAILTGRASRLDCALGIIANVGGLLGNVSSFAEGLASFGAVSASSVAFAGPLGIVGSALGIAGLLATGIGMVKTHRYGKKFDAEIQYHDNGRSMSELDFGRAMGFFECDLPEKDPNLTDEQNQSLFKKANSVHKGKIKRFFRVNPEKLTKNLGAIKDNQDQINDNDRGLLVKTLKERVTTTNWSNAMTILSGTVSLIGVAILVISPLVFPPLMPLGFSCLALGAGISIFKFGFDLISEFQFNRVVRNVFEKATHGREEPSIRDYDDRIPDIPPNNSLDQDTVFVDVDSGMDAAGSDAVPVFA